MGVALLPVTQGGFLVDDASLLASGPGLGPGPGLGSGPGLASGQGLTPGQGLAPGPGLEPGQGLAPGLGLVPEPIGLPLVHSTLTLRLSLLNLQHNGLSKRAQEKLNRYVLENGGGLNTLQPLLPISCPSRAQEKLNRYIIGDSCNFSILFKKQT